MNKQSLALRNPDVPALAISDQVRLAILEQSYRARFGHIGSALSVADIIPTILDGIVRTDSADRDRFILSKGHAALALYASLYVIGRIDQATLDTYCADGSPLGAHPEHVVDGIDFSTGSLGQGVSYGVGSAMAAKITGSPRQCFVVMSDAELNEGSVWEAAMFAAHHKLSNLAVVIDSNGQQAMGETRTVVDLEPVLPRWQAFGWDACEIDGHDVAALRSELVRRPMPGMRPRVIVARTVAGYGVSFMENQVKWRYMPLNDEQYAKARAEVLARRESS